MKVSNDLFELIRSMDKTEKRYFVLNSGKVNRSSKLYLELFKALDKEKIYNEKEFLLADNGSTWIFTSNYRIKSSTIQTPAGNQHDGNENGVNHLCKRNA